MKSGTQSKELLHLEKLIRSAGESECGTAQNRVRTASSRGCLLGCFQAIGAGRRTLLLRLEKEVRLQACAFPEF